MRPISAPDSVSRSVVREGAQAAARNTGKRGAHAAAPAPQASLTVSRQPSHPGCGENAPSGSLRGSSIVPAMALRRTSRIWRLFARNATHVGLNQRLLRKRCCRQYIKTKRHNDYYRKSEMDREQRGENRAHHRSAGVDTPGPGHELRRAASYGTEPQRKRHSHRKSERRDESDRDRDFCRVREAYELSEQDLKRREVDDCHQANCKHYPCNRPKSHC